MRTKETRKFNIICIALSAVFLIGIVFQWRNAFAQTQKVANVVDVEIVENVRNTRNDENNEDVGNGGNVVSVVNDKNDENDIQQAERSNKTDDSTSGSTTTITSITVSSTVLPPSVNLPVPFTSQAPEGNWDQPWQDACEEAAVLMLDAYYKKYGLSKLFSKDEIIKMVAWEEEKGWGRSIEIQKVRQVAEWYMGKQLTYDKRQLNIVENPTIDDIKKSIAAGDPVLAVAYGKDLPNPNFRNGGPEYHALIIRGYTEDSFITNDPGTRKGENFVYTYNDLMNAIRDWNQGNVTQGRRVVLMLK